MGVLSMELFRQQAFPGSRRRWPKLSILALAVWLTAALSSGSPGWNRSRLV